jgi:hypothetical protein
MCSIFFTALFGEASRQDACAPRFALWKDVDADIPILIEAKKEYEKLK